MEDSVFPQFSLPSRVASVRSWVHGSATAFVQSGLLFSTPLSCLTPVSDSASEWSACPPLVQAQSWLGRAASFHTVPCPLQHPGSPTTHPVSQSCVSHAPPPLSARPAGLLCCLGQSFRPTSPRPCPETSPSLDAAPVPAWPGPATRQLVVCPLPTVVASRIGGPGCPGQGYWTGPSSDLWCLLGDSPCSAQTKLRSPGCPLPDAHSCYGDPLPVFSAWRQ